MKIAFILMIAMQLFMTSSVQAKTALPDINVMPGMKTKWVADNFIYNSYPMNIQQFESSKSAQAVMEYYQSLWSINKTNKLPYRFENGRYLIGRENNKTIQSVSAADDSVGSYGSLAVSSATPLVRNTALFPTPPYATQLTMLESVDIGNSAQSITLHSRSEILINKQWYEHTLKSSGWVKMDSNNTTDETVEMQFQKNKQLCRIKLYPLKRELPFKTLILIHWIKG